MPLIIETIHTQGIAQLSYLIGDSSAGRAAVIDPRPDCGTARWLPPFWEARFGPDSLALRGAVAFLGGGLMAFGARMAGGCTSGHGISGTLQLNLASWISLVCFFAGGVAVANLIYRT